MRLYSLSIFLFIVCSSLVFPQLSNGSIISIKDGLSQNSGKVIYQDKLGFIWIGTNDGLNRYDGYEIKTFKNNPKDSNSISGNVVKSIVEDENNNLWIGTGNGISVYDLKSGKFKHNKLPEIMLDSLKNKHVVALLAERNGHIWIGTREGIYKYDQRKNNFSCCTEKNNPLSPMKRKYIMTFMMDKIGDIWIGTFNAGLYKYEKKNHCLKKINLLDTTSPSVFSIVESGNDILIGTFQKGLYVYNTLSNTIKCVEPKLYQYSSNIFQIIQQKENSFLLSTQDGIFSFDKKNYSFTKIWDESGIPRSIIIDKSNCLFIATDGFGVYKYLLEKDKFTTVRNRDDISKGLTFSSVRTFLKDKNNRFWIGGHSTLNVSPSSNQFNFSNIKGLNGFNIYSIIEDPIQNNSYWIGTEGSGLLKYDYSKKLLSFPLKKLFQEKNLTPFAEVYKIINSRNGNIYFATDKSLVEYNSTTKQYREYLHQSDLNNSIVERKYKALFEDKDSNIWIGSDRDGISVLDTTTNKFTNFRADGNSSSLSSNRVNCIMQDKTGTIWIGTENGLNKLLPSNRRFKIFNKDNGFANDYIYGIEEDRKGFLWLSSNKGIMKFDPLTEKVINFDESYGLQSNEFNTCAYYKSSDGKMYFGGIKGFTAFIPEEVKLSNFKPSTLLTKFKKYNIEYNLPKNIAYTQTVYLNYDDYFFSFEFSSNDFSNPTSIKYRYMLKGFNDNWIYTNSGFRSANFTNISPGTYNFLVESTNRDGLWSGKQTSVLLVIAPAFWTTWWFRLIMISILSGIVFLLYRSRINRLKIEKDIQRDLTNQLINSHEEERKNISYELHDDLGQNLLVVKNKLLLARRDNSLDKNIDSVLSLLDNSIQDISNISHLLHPSELEALGLTQAIEAMCYRVEAATKIKINNSLKSIDEFFLKEESINLFRIIQEALNNIIKHSKASTVEIKKTVNSNLLIIEIIDNGIGFDCNDDRIKNERPHLGLKGMQERVWMLKGKLKVYSSANIGTTISIEFQNRNYNKDEIKY